jgi:hypothetical protein
MKRFVATLALCASIATVSFGTKLTFDNLTGYSIPLDYGSRVNASGMDAAGRAGYDLTFGATPNVAVQMFWADYSGGTWNRVTDLGRWYSDYANLTYVAYTYDGGRIIFTADAGAQVSLHSFQMGGWPNTDQILLFLQVLVDGNPVYTQSNIPISGTTANTFSFDPNVVRGGVIEIRWADNTGARVGIDNIAFSQTGGCAPNPADVDGDGDVDDADLLEVLFNFGWSCGG